MSEPFAVIADVENRWRSLTDEEAVVAETFLDHASLIFRAALPGLDDRIAADTTLTLGELVRHEVAESVRRTMLNPEGWREVAIDDYRRIRDAALSSGALFVTEEQIDRLRPVGRRGGAFTITPGAGVPST